MLAGGPRGRGDGKPADPAHPLGGFAGVIAELLRHPAGAALRTKPEQGAADPLFDAASGQSLRWLQPGGNSASHRTSFTVGQVITVPPLLAVRRSSIGPRSRTEAVGCVEEQLLQLARQVAVPHQARGSR